MTFGQVCYGANNELLNRKLAEKKHLIAVHRGSWTGNIIQNTIPAYTCAFKMGADMVECDINRTVDGVLYSFHDGYEPDLFRVQKSIKQMTSAEVDAYRPYNAIRSQCRRPIDRLSDILDWLPADKLLNIDRAWDIFPYLLEELDRHPNALQQAVLKCTVRGSFHGVPLEEALSALQMHERKYMFMPICYSMEDVERALSLQGVNLVGCELIAHKETDELYQDAAIAYLHEHGLFAWVNAIQLGDYQGEPLYGPLDDNVSLTDDPDKGWGQLFRKGIDIVQTDWPAILYAYRKDALHII